MVTQDSKKLRNLLFQLMPGLHIEKVLKPSGQRVVYFVNFDCNAARDKQKTWGPCVLKVTEELSVKQIAYLQKEIEILNSLNSFFYPKLFYYDAFTHNPETENKLPARLFVTLEERIDSIPLSECKERFLDPKAAVDLLNKLIDALTLLWNHDRRLVHRDIKPENILVKPNGDIVIIDLGIIREEGADGLTEIWYPFGPCSPPYASPEQAKNDKKNISFKSDFFCLGTLMYELLSGTNPFFNHKEMARDEILARVVNYDPETLAKEVGVHPEFSRLIEKMMSKEPYQRHRTIEGLKNNINKVKGALDGY